MPSVFQIGAQVSVAVGQLPAEHLNHGKGDAKCGQDWFWHPCQKNHD